MTLHTGSILSFFRIIIALLPNIGKTLIVFTIVIALYELAKFIPPYLVKLIIDNIFSTPDLSYILILIGAIFFVLSILTFVEVRFLQDIIRVAANQYRNIMHNAYTKLLDLPLSWHESNNTGTLISKITKAGGYVQQFAWFIANDIIPITLQVILTGIILVWIDWRIGLIYILFTPLIIYSIDKLSRGIMPIRNAYQKDMEYATTQLSQGLTNIQTVKDYVGEQYELRKERKYLDSYVSLNIARAKTEYWAIILREIIINFVRCLTLVVAVWLVFDGQLTPGDLVLVFTLTEKAYINLHRMGRIYQFMGDTQEAFSRALAIKQTINPLKNTGKKLFRNGDIIIDNVSFGYGASMTLQNISVCIPHNKITAIVGASGSGKSTLVKLIMRHYDVGSGQIKIHNTPIQQLRLESLRQHIAFVSQTTELFDRTVAQNIAYGMDGASRKSIIQAAKQANAHDFIMNLPNGYDTLIGERGVRLSGGQRQRISIARALLSKADVIIFDEATSSLDSESEKAIQKAVLSIKNKTLIVIAHRLSTIEHAHQIVVLSKGRIAQKGSHSDLLKHAKGIYTRMRKLQQLGELRT